MQSFKTFAVTTITAVTFSLSVVSADTIAPGLESVRPYPTQRDVCQIVRGALVQDYAEDSVIACPTRERGAISDRKGEGAQELRKAGSWTLLALAARPDLDDLTAQYLGYTVVFFDRSHGTQVEYFDKSGAYLWYPGNTAVLPGGWKNIAKPAGRSEICFKYTTTSYNPVTGVRGGGWECRLVQSNQSDITHRLKGDPFDLLSGEVPYIFKPRRRFTPAKLAREAGIDRSDLVDVGKP